MTRDGVRSPRLQPDASYSSRFSKNVEWMLGPWFILFGGFLSIELFFLNPPILQPGQPSPDFVVVFPIVGVVLTYFAFFRRVYRLETVDGLLYWFLPFRRVAGHAPVEDIDSIWSENTVNRYITQTAIQFRNGRIVRVRNSAGISAFVAVLVAQSPHIDIADWESLEPPGRSGLYQGQYPTNGDY